MTRLCNSHVRLNMVGNVFVRILPLQWVKIYVWFNVFRLVLLKHNSPLRTYQYKVNVKTKNQH